VLLQVQELTKRNLKIAFLLILLGGFFVVFFLFDPIEHSFFLPCPFRYAMGYLCPGCGSQRAFHQLFHGNIINAFRLNPLMIVSIPLVAYGLGLTIYNFIFETNYRFKLFYSNTFIYIYFGIAIVYWIVRNIPVFPFTYLQAE